MSHTDSLEPWSLRIDTDGTLYWYRREGLTEAKVKHAPGTADAQWMCIVGIGSFTTQTHTRSLRAAKVRATKLLREYRLQETFYALSEGKLRQSSVGDHHESDKPLTGDHQSDDPEQITEAGITWKWNRDTCIWQSNAWSLMWSQKHGWILQYPAGAQQVLRASMRTMAMREAAFWIARHREGKA